MIEDYLNSEENIFSIQIKEKNEKKIIFTISDDFDFDLILQTLQITSQDEFLTELCQKVNQNSLKNVVEVLKLVQKEYGNLMDPDSPLYKGQDVFDLDNDNNDIKFLERVRYKEDDFNSDLWLNVYLFLEPIHLLKLSRVSKQWLKLTRDEEVWKSICLREKLEAKSDLSWRETYIEENSSKFKWSILSSSIEKISDFRIRQTDANSNSKNQRTAYCERVITQKTRDFTITFNILGFSSWIGVGFTRQEHAKINQSWTGVVTDKTWMYSANGYTWSEDVNSNQKCIWPPYNVGDQIKIKVEPFIKKATFYKNDVETGNLMIEFPCVVCANIIGDKDEVEIIKNK